MKKSVGSGSRFFIGMAIIMAIMTISDGCKKSSNAYDPGNGGGGTKGTGPGANEVWIQDYAFNPTPIEITTGTTVTWTNQMGITHTVTSDTGLFDSGYINPSGTFSYMFGTAGSYSYHCTTHTYMVGTVIVKDPVVVPGY